MAMNTAHGAGLPAGNAWNLPCRHSLAVDGAGTRLAIGATAGNLRLSQDGAQSWQRLSAALPPIAVVVFAPSGCGGHATFERIREP